ncbi:MAG TPA: hypothetical protein VFF27_12670 [Bacteroidia bacterium]|jgi:membrane-associated phospholipid phosphatase|nr:hypothetical protein [Bacteroidia bacterium]
MDEQTVVKAPTSGEEKFAKFLSIIFHPLLMPTYGFVLLFSTQNYLSTFLPFQFKLIIIGLTFLFTFLFPAINAVVLLKIGRIKSLEMNDPRERLLPYGTTLLYYMALLYLLYNSHFSVIFKVIIIGAACCILTTLAVNLKWKISAHMVGAGGITGAILALLYRLESDMQLAFIIIILIAGLVGYARLKLNAHTPAQVYTGFLVGFLIQLSLLLFF